MRPVRRLPLLALLAFQTVAACDCESMLATRRRPGAPTTSEHRGGNEPAPMPTRPAATARPAVTAVRPEPAVAPAQPGEAPPEIRMEKLQPERATPIAPVRPGRGAFDRLRPVKLPRNVMPAQRLEGGAVEQQAAEPVELLDR